MNDLLKFITCGSVDDGKSTLIGHMLYDAKLLFADQEKSLILDSKIGSRDGEIDYSLLLDGLMAEREQGITIDVAYRYFTTENRSFIVADTPGHEEYTRNMAVGASFADLAVILVDSSKGVLIQTKRHSRICSLMGIRHFVFAVNKMDLVDYEEEIFERIVRQIHKLMAEFNYLSLVVIPVSATDGDNIIRPSQRTPWYRGKTLLRYLEEIDITQDRSDRDFAMAVQRVSRPNHEFRGFQGQIDSGHVAVGDQVCVLPSGEKARVERLLLAGSETEEAEEGHAVTICLDREIDISRGNVLAADSESLMVGNQFTTSLLWMDDRRLVEGRNYLLKLGTARIPATVMKIRYRIDVNTGDEVKAESVYKNELAVCDLSVSERIAFDLFDRTPSLGSFILIDRISNMTSACGVVTGKIARSDHLTWYPMDISRDQRAEQKGQKPVTIWFTGLSGSGKSSLANALERKLYVLGKHTMTLDGDNIRLGLNKNLSFREADRVENIRRVAEVAKLMNDAGLIAISSFVSPYTLDRKKAKEIIGPENFLEIYVSTPLEECERRDIKGLYARARKGEIPNFTGISAPYEVPESPDIIVDTSRQSLEECVDIIMKELETRI